MEQRDDVVDWKDAMDVLTAMVEVKLNQPAPSAPMELPGDIGSNEVPAISASVIRPDLVTVSSKAATYRRGLTKLKLQRNNTINKPLLITSVVFNVVLLLFLVGVGVMWMLNKENSPLEICKTKECLASAYKIASAIDKSKDPCEDFYDFACGKWQEQNKATKKNQHTSQFKYAEDNLRKSALDLLTEPKKRTDPTPVKLAKDLYDECMKTELIEFLGLHPLKEVLAQLGLPRALPQDNDTKNFDLTKTLSEIQYHLPTTDTLITVGIAVRPGEESRKMLSLSRPHPNRDFKYEFASIVGRDPEYVARRKKRKAQEFVRDEVRYRSSVMELFESEKTEGDKLNETVLRVAASQTLTTEGNIRKTYPKKPTCKSVTIADLQKATDRGARGKTALKIDWLAFVKYLFKDIKGVKIDENYQILTDSMDYFSKVASIINRAKSEAILRFLWWKVVDFFTKYSTKTMRELRYANDGFYGYQQSIHRAEECMKTVEETVPIAVIYKFLSQPDMNVTKIRVEEMLTDIKESLATSLEVAEWMDENTTAEALDKIDYMNYTIGLPDDYLQHDYLESLYLQDTVDRGNFLQSVVNFYGAESKRVLSTIHQPLKMHEMSASLLEPLQINAFNSIITNSIVILPGMLQTPFFGMGLEVMNYAAIGSILGHEIMHGFDNLGRLYDKDGNARSWWSKNTTKEYEKKIKCFVNQYNHYKLFDKPINGKLTLGENIADNVGLQQAFSAYKNYKSRKGSGPMLPGLEEFSDDQLFFIAYAHIWCSNSTKDLEEVLLHDQHCPAKYRVLGTLTNMNEFSDTWNCPEKTLMNPLKKCSLW